MQRQLDQLHLRPGAQEDIIGSVRVRASTAVPGDNPRLRPRPVRRTHSEAHGSLVLDHLRQRGAVIHTVTLSAEVTAARGVWGAALHQSISSVCRP